MFPKIRGKPPKSSILIGFFHYFHHPFWGKYHPYFWIDTHLTTPPTSTLETPCRWAVSPHPTRSPSTTADVPAVTLGAVRPGEALPSPPLADRESKWSVTWVALPGCRYKWPNKFMGHCFVFFNPW